jgi:hypothetical protein
MAPLRTHTAITFLPDFVICRVRLGDYGQFSANKRFMAGVSGYDSDEPRVENGFGVALTFMTLAPDIVVGSAGRRFQTLEQPADFRAGPEPGQLNTATCRSYAYIFNVKTSEYFRCQVTLALTRDNKEVINVQSDGGCAKKPRIFENDSNYSFDATETEPPNTNSFFGAGGYAVWASDNTARKVRGCIIISSGLGSDISKCLDMNFE